MLRMPSLRSRVAGTMLWGLCIVMLMANAPAQDTGPEPAGGGPRTESVAKDASQIIDPQAVTPLTKVVPDAIEKRELLAKPIPEFADLAGRMKDLEGDPKNKVKLKAYVDAYARASEALMQRLDDFLETEKAVKDAFDQSLKQGELHLAAVRRDIEVYAQKLAEGRARTVQLREQIDELLLEHQDELQGDDKSLPEEIEELYEDLEDQIENDRRTLELQEYLRELAEARSEDTHNSNRTNHKSKRNLDRSYARARADKLRLQEVALAMEKLLAPGPDVVFVDAPISNKSLPLPIFTPKPNAGLRPLASETNTRARQRLDELLQAGKKPAAPQPMPVAME